MVAENSMRNLLRQHRGATRAGTFGDFAFAFQINGGIFDGNNNVFIAPGDEYSFEILDLAANQFKVHVRNDTTGQGAGPAFVQETDVTAAVVTIGSDPALGAARLTFQGNDALDFTTGMSEAKSGQIAAVAAVKFQGPNIVGLRFNSTGNFPTDNGVDFSTITVRNLANNQGIVGGAWGFVERL